MFTDIITATTSTGSKRGSTSHLRKTDNICAAAALAARLLAHSVMKLNDVPHAHQKST